MRRFTDFDLRHHGLGRSMSKDVGHSMSAEWRPKAHFEPLNFGLASLALHAASGELTEGGSYGSVGLERHTEVGVLRSAEFYDRRLPCSTE